MGGSESHHGYRLIDIQKDSPGEKAGLRLYLDFIVSINGTNLLESQIPLQDLIRLNENCTITLGVLGLDSMSIREITVAPSVWEGEGLLGVNLRYEDASEALQNILHITKVFPNTPASNAGIVDGEYILGSKEAKIKDSSELREILMQNGEITLVVYNKDSKGVRWVLLESVDGSLGVEIATGVMHRIPGTS